MSSAHRGPPLRSDGTVSRIARRLGMSFTEVARECGVPYQSVKNWNRRGRLPESFEKRLVELIESRAASVDSSK